MSAGLILIMTVVRLGSVPAESDAKKCKGLINISKVYPLTERQIQ